TLPPGGPTGAGGIAPGVAATPAPAAHAAPVAAPAAARPGAAAPMAPRSSVQQRPAPVAAAPAQGVSGLDAVLAIAAAVAGLVAIGSVLYLAFVVLAPA